MNIYLDPSIGGDFIWPDSIIALILKERYGSEIKLTSFDRCDLAIYGPYPEPHRSFLCRAFQRFQKASSHECIRLHITMENERPQYDKYEYFIGFDLGITNPNYLRFPYWMFVLDWPQLKAVGETYSRFGHLLSIDRLLEPLGSGFLERKRRAAFLTTHLREPRKSIFDLISETIPVDGFGRAFDSSVHHHKGSNLPKSEILASYAFNLCPENSMHPGYYTEKIPESFSSGCLPLAWSDPLVAHDFNPDAVINLYGMNRQNQPEWSARLKHTAYLSQFADQPLLKQRPSLLPLENFIDRVIVATNS